MVAIPDTTFPRSARLLTGAQYAHVFKDNKRSADRFFTILFVKNPVSPGRLGMAVSKKCAKRAVDRNRLKRLARESFRQHKHCVSGFDIVLLARPPSVDASNSAILQSLQNHWNRISANA